MSFLGIDLDETLLVMEQRKDLIHPDTVLSEKGEYLYEGSISLKFQIINPIEVSRLITKAITEHDGVFIMTAALYDREILITIAEKLNLEPEVKRKFLDSKFFSAKTDTKYFKYDDGSCIDPATVATIDKCTRLSRIMAVDNDFLGKGVLFLDNDIDHVRSFKDSGRVVPVLAETEAETVKTQYYVTAAKGLEEIQRREEIHNSQNKQVLEIERQRDELLRKQLEIEKQREALLRQQLALAKQREELRMHQQAILERQKEEQKRKQEAELKARIASLVAQNISLDKENNTPVQPKAKDSAKIKRKKTVSIKLEERPPLKELSSTESNLVNNCVFKISKVRKKDKSNENTGTVRMRISAEASV